MSEIYSMTGYGRSEGEVSGVALTVEAKSVNHRYLDMKLHCPRDLLGFESRITEVAKKYLSRGRVDLWVNYAPGQSPARVSWNRTMAEGLVKALGEMKREFGLEGGLTVSLLASMKDVIIADDSGSWSDESWEELRPLFEDCFSQMNQMRAREGKALSEDLRTRMDTLREKIGAIKELAPRVPEMYREKLEKRMADLMEKGPAGEDRLAQEAALFADRADITEELVRLAAHLDRFDETLSEDGAKGRKMDFLVQEMFREINTAGNKAQDADISSLSVDVKTEIEKIREQIQNLE